jgi:hypothetical protein
MNPFFDDRAIMPDSVLIARIVLHADAAGPNAFVEALLDTLTLFRVCSLAVSRISQIPRSLRALREIPYARQAWPTFAATLTAADADELGAFVTEMLSIIQEHQKTSATAPTSGWIALTRYRDALSLRVGNASTTSAVSAIEAILLGSNERDELTRTFTQRTAALLSHFGHDPVEVAAESKRAYLIRSKYIHGSNVKGDQETQDARARAAVETARQCLVAVLSLERQGLDKDQITKALDQQLLSQVAHRETNMMYSGVTMPGSPRGVTGRDQEGGPGVVGG